jgi:hypothetical protein
MRYLLHLFEVALVGAAQRADPIFRDIVKSGTGGNATIGVTQFRVIDVITDHAAVLSHRSSPLFAQGGSWFLVEMSQKFNRFHPVGKPTANDYRVL